MGRHIKNAKDADERVLIDRLWDVRRIMAGMQQEHDEIRDILRRGRLGDRKGNEHALKIVSVREHDVTFTRHAHRRIIYGRR
jgi:hypothetical protein